jgi:hypothetical protein
MNDGPYARPGQEEIDHVIKAGGITSFDEYAALDRAGRGVPLDREQRDTVWRLYADHQRLVKCRIHDLNDVLIAARGTSYGLAARATKPDDVRPGVMRGGCPGDQDV